MDKDERGLILREENREGLERCSEVMVVWKEN